MVNQPVAMVEVFRGDILESIHFGHAVIARANGEIVDAWGNPEQVILPRSSVKILQALPLLESGAGKHLKSEQLALACASHSGERRHVEKVSQWLDSLGLDENALRCGPQSSRDRSLRHEMIRNSEPVTRVFNNCSGKHTGFLTLTKHLQAGPDYVDPGHPVQKAVRTAFEEMTGEESTGFGIDGCSAPNFATTVRGLARAMANCAVARQGSGARNKAAAALTDAMMAHPEMVSGKGRACAAIMNAAKGKAAVKTGAEGVFIAILPELELGIALKIADGATRASEIAIVALLCRLGVLDKAEPAVAHYLNTPVNNWDGLMTGYMRPVEGVFSLPRI